MRTDQIVVCLVILFHIIVFGQGSGGPSNTSVTSMLNYRADLKQVSERFEHCKQCNSTYRSEIQTRIGNLMEEMETLSKKERTLFAEKLQPNVKERKLRKKMQQHRIRDSLAYCDTSLNKMQLRRKAKAERKALRKQMWSENAKKLQDPRWQEIRESISLLHKQISDSIAVILKDDPKCLQCYTPTK